MHPRILTAALAAAVCLAVGAAAAQKKPATQPKPTVKAASVTMKPYKGPLPPLPTADYPLPRPSSVVREVYEFAGRRPDVLQYVPCFCGCEQAGHVGNDDCFVKSRDASGKPTEWEAHGMG